MADRLEAMGGVHAIFLTHRDDVADHSRWAARFGAPRVMHADDVGPRTKDVELKLEGSGPWGLRLLEKNVEDDSEDSGGDGDADSDARGIGKRSGSGSGTGREVSVEVRESGDADNDDEEEEEEEELLLIYTPGHTAGCVSLLLRRRGRARGAPGVLFTGDHLAARKQQATAAATAISLL